MSEEDSTPYRPLIDDPPMAPVAERTKGPARDRRLLGVAPGSQRLSLKAHRNGRLSGDQFCVYIANRRVIPALTADQLKRFRHGELRLDALSRDHIREHLDYQYVVVDSSRAAHDLERRCRRGEVFGVKPILNPL